MKRGVTFTLAMLFALAIYATAASATVVHICVPEKAGTAITSNGTAEACKEKETAVQLPASSTEQKALISILPYITFKSAGVDSKPTILFSKANIQVVNGEGKTATANGEGNIVIGYNETPGTETGSHNLVLGGTQKYTSYADILGGNSNTALVPFATLTGQLNEATSFGTGALVSGVLNKVGGEDGSITGGCGNSIFVPGGGGAYCAKEDQGSSVTGGSDNQAAGSFADKDDEVSGGNDNLAAGETATVLGGFDNIAEFTYSTVSGGGKNRSDGEYSSVTGGANNFASGAYSTVTGGGQNKTPGELSVVVGGSANEVDFGDVVLGGGGHHLAGSFEIFPE
jgi:hypothetical protein